jgi:molybdopterin-guanine dinucleotide biosynthesis protein A
VAEPSPKRRAPSFAVVILAGGASSRLGRDKARVRVGGRTLLQHVRAAARAAGGPVRVLRRDAVPQCGPLGGVLTALLKRGTRGVERERSRVLVFLSCDMPFVNAEMIRRVAAATSSHRWAAFFADADRRAGFPFAVRAEALPVVRRQIAHGRFSVQDFARAVNARRLRIPPRTAWRWFNVNTPDDVMQARRIAQTKGCFRIGAPKRRLSARRKGVSSRHDSP